MWEMKCGIDEMLGSLVSLLKDMKVHTADNDSITEEIFVAQMNAENLKRSSQETSQLLPQSPDDIQLNDCGDSVRSTSHVGYDMVHYQNWEQMATSTTEESQTNTASGDEVHVEQIRVFGLTPSSAVDKNKLVSGRVQVFHASSAPVGQGHIQGRTNTKLVNVLLFSVYLRYSRVHTVCVMSIFIQSFSGLWKALSLSYTYLIWKSKV